MKNQALFYSKDKSKKLKCRLLQFLFSALRVNIPFEISSQRITEVCFSLNFPEFLVMGIGP